LTNPAFHARKKTAKKLFFNNLIKEEDMKNPLKVVSGFFSGFKFTEGLGSMLGDFGRVLAEDKYDEVAQKSFFAKLKEQPLPIRHGIGFFLLAGNYVLSKKLPEDSFFKKIFKEGATDTAPEFYKRLINGVKETQNPVEKGILMAMASNPEKSKDFLLWINGLTEEKRTNIKERMHKLMPENIAMLTNLEPDLIEQFLIFSEKPEPKKNEKGESFRWEVALKPVIERLKTTPETKGEQK
jgi:hypothetical protein